MRLLLFLLLTPFGLSAQKDPDIVWAAVIEQDWVVDVPSLETEWDFGVTTLKLLRPGQKVPHWESPYLVDYVFQAIKKGQIPIFEDADCTIPADLSRIYPDTSWYVVFDPESYKDSVVIVAEELDPSQIVRAWRLRQVLTYHRKSATWSSTVKAIAPLVQETFWGKDSTKLRPWCWFRPENKRRKLSSRHVVWAKETVSKTPQTQVPVFPEHLLKSAAGFQNPVRHLFKVLETDMKTPFYSPWNGEPLSPSERRSMLARTDTTVSYARDIYEEHLTITHQEINPDSISSLRLVQTWYWDERRHRLSVCLDAVAPMLDVFDVMDNLRFSKPLFYRRAKE